MKQKIIFTSIIALAIYSQIVSAGSITDTYAAGDTLTAAKMDNIKNAVNSNATNISGNTTNIGINALGITNNTTNIAALFSGDGSAGDLTVSTSTNWVFSPPDNPYFNNITINAGQTLTVPAGTTIYCTGTFTNNGIIAVSTGATSLGTDWVASSPASSGPLGSAHPGDTFGAATRGGFDNDGIADPVTLNGGKGGIGIPRTYARFSFGKFRIGGGSGATASSASSGGGLVKIYCSGDIVNNGTINANGANGPSAAGGGGGGIVVLASRTLVDNTSGTINATGGNGGGDSSLYGSSGGGGGGIVIMMSSTAPIAGTTDVSGGLGDVATSTQTSKGRLAGSGGGASGGYGGSGGNVSSGGVNSSGSNGDAGYILTITGNPSIIAR